MHQRMLTRERETIGLDACLHEYYSVDMISGKGILHRNQSVFIERGAAGQVAEVHKRAERADHLRGHMPYDRR